MRACVHADAEAACVAVRDGRCPVRSYPAYARQFAPDGAGGGGGAGRRGARRASGTHGRAERSRHAVAALGDPTAARARLEEYRSAGADLVVVYPVVVPGSTLARSALTTLESLAPNG